jgi:hypothetical protein
MVTSKLMTHSTLLLLGVAAVIGGCETETTPPPSVAGLTSAEVVAVNADTAAQRIAKARCQRAAECNRTGRGQMYVDQQECRDEERTLAAAVARACPGGVSKGKVDDCVANLENQYCDADMGPVTAMPECRSYCAR